MRQGKEAGRNEWESKHGPEGERRKEGVRQGEETK